MLLLIFVLQTNEKGQVVTKTSLLKQMEELIEEPGLTCCICREGYKFQVNDRSRIMNRDDTDTDRWLLSHIICSVYHVQTIQVSSVQASFCIYRTDSSCLISCPSQPKSWEFTLSQSVWPWRTLKTSHASSRATALCRTLT